MTLPPLAVTVCERPPVTVTLPVAKLFKAETVVVAAAVATILPAAAFATVKAVVPQVVTSVVIPAEP